MKKSFVIALAIFLTLGSLTILNDNRTEFFPKVELKADMIPEKHNIWVFIMAGQSNMAGRGQVEAMDTIPHPRILSINKNGELIIAKEPLHFYEPAMTGLDCGLSFGKELLKLVPDSVSILMLPTAVGGSSIRQWVNDSSFRGVTLFSNFKEKVEIGKKYWTIKGILWHQGETDASKVETINIYDAQLEKLFAAFRTEVGNKELPVFIGELGSFSKNDAKWQSINSKISTFIERDSNSYLVKTSDLFHKGDSVHFDAEGQRKMGERFAERFIEMQK
jgi:hypothetical protein